MRRGSRFGRLGDPATRIVLVGSAVSLAGCTDRVIEVGADDGDPTAGSQDSVPGRPQLIDVRFLDGQSLQLTYSEPMADPSTAEPSAFRLSMAAAYDYAEYQATSYIALQNYNGALQCDEYCDAGSCYEYCYGTPGYAVDPVALASDPLEPSRVILELSHPVTSGICGTLRTVGRLADRSGLFLHYSDGFAGGITDVTGELALPLAEHWVLAGSGDYQYVDAVFPAMDPFLPIPCDF